MKSSSIHHPSRNSSDSIQSIHSYNANIEEEEEDFDSQKLIDNTDSISQLIQESKTRNKFQQENVKLRQQLLKERKKFEKEKQSLLEQNLPLREQSKKNLLLIEKISQIIGIQSNSPNFEEKVLSKLASINNQPQESALNYEQESMKLKDIRITELESALQEGQNLIHSMEEEIDQKVSEIRQKQDFLDKQQKTIEELSLLIRQFMVAAESTESPEEAIQSIHDMKRKFRRIETMSETQKIDELMRQFEERRADEYGKVYKQLEDQGNLLNNAIEAIQANSGTESDSSAQLKDIYQQFQDTNKLLSERMQQLRGKMFPDTGNSQSGSRMTTSASLSSSKAAVIDNSAERYDKDGLGPSIWIAKTREMLSLERQLIKTNQRLETANRNCQCLANENLYYHYSAHNGKHAQRAMPSTLL